MKRQPTPPTSEIPSPEAHPAVLAASAALNDVVGRRREAEAGLAAAVARRGHGLQASARDEAARRLLDGLDGGELQHPEPEEEVRRSAVELDILKRAEVLAAGRLGTARDEAARELGRGFQPQYNAVLARFAAALVEAGKIAAEAEALRLQAGALEYQRVDLSGFRTDRPGTRTVLLLDDLASRCGVDVPAGRATGLAPVGRWVA